MRVIGKIDNDNVKAPTLRQFHKLHGKSPDVSYAKIIFRPGKYDAFGIVTHHGFRVSIGNDNEAYRFLIAELDEIELREVCIAIVVDDGAKGAFSVAIDEDKRTIWESSSFGLRAEDDDVALKRKRSATPRKSDSKTRTLTPQDVGLEVEPSTNGKGR